MLVLNNMPNISAETDCGGDIDSILKECGKFIQKKGSKIPPSPKCCGTLKSVDFTCLCGALTITPEVGDLIDGEKTIYVAIACGLHIPKVGTKCGPHYSIPSSPSPSPPKA
ncbi:Bifunctional inhibitor/plant lipid transfer protein/seed storage helical domain [Sesbania bispinosa]|nr:Bifunctional inhibitor/plant lipid transfer protein/seed storage helical domain [Sesbania bispinosa]